MDWPINGESPVHVGYLLCWSFNKTNTITQTEYGDELVSMSDSDWKGFDTIYEKLRGSTNDYRRKRYPLILIAIPQFIVLERI